MLCRNSDFNLFIDEETKVCNLGRILSQIEYANVDGLLQRQVFALLRPEWEDTVLLLCFYIMQMRSKYEEAANERRPIFTCWAAHVQWAKGPAV